MSEDTKQKIADEFAAARVHAINHMALEIYAENKKKGFWDAPDEIKALHQALDDHNGQIPEEVYTAAMVVVEKFSKRNVGELLMLIVSELGEALEAHRKNLNDDHLPERKGLEVELGDAMIRILDMFGGLRMDGGGAIEDKRQYNKSRPPKHGKAY